jgi:Cytochrome c bacterial/Cytochrome c7 and related cytochrome c
VTLTAPATATGGSFLKWQKGAADYATSAKTTVTMSAAATMTAVYGAAGHAGITGTFTTPAQVTAMCLTCHSGQGTAAVNSLHGMMPTLSPKVINAPGLSQKLAEINTFCSYPNPDMAAAACLNCHPTLGKFENLAATDIDCLQCHNDAYKRRFTPEPDSAKWVNVVDWMGLSKTYVPAYKKADGYFQIEFNWAAMPGITALDLVRGVKKPTTTTCLSCHAKAGGSDWAKRGDLGLNSASATAAQDVHLASVANGGAGLSCTSCHVPANHKIPGRGIDLRPTETGVAVKTCEQCHASMATGGGHAALGIRVEPDRHIKRLACQSCHIPAFGKGGATEMSRNWTLPVWNATLCNGQGAWAGEESKVANVVPDHVFFNGASYVYALGQTLNRIDPISGSPLMADAVGGVNDAVGVSKLVPIKRHKSNMAVMSSGTNAGKVIPFDVVWQFMTGFSDQAAERGKAFAGYTGSHEWKWVEAEMAINHGVAPRADVAACTNCHHGRNQFSTAVATKLDKLGYALKDADKNGVVNAADEAVICSQCHLQKAFKQDWEQQHAHTQKGSGIGCTWCHDIKRPERGLCEPCNPDGTENTACRNEFVDTNYYNHCQ